MSSPLNVSRRFRNACAAVAAVALILGSATSAQAESSHPAILTNSEVTALAEFWTEHNVDPKVQDDLIAGIHTGTLPDSLTGNAVPSVTEESSDAGWDSTIYTFDDGSVVEAQLEIAEPAPLAQPRVAPSSAINKCTVTSGSGFRTYKDCKVQGNSGITGFGFYLSYTLVQGGNDYILESYGPTKMCVWPAACDQPFKDRVKLREDAGGVAGVSYGMAWSAGASGTSYLTVKVGRDSAKVVYG